MLDLERPLTETLLLRTIPGAVDYLFEELRGVPEVSVTGRRRDGLVIGLDGPLSAIAGVRYFVSAAVVLGEDPANDLLASAESGALSAVSGALRFRIGQIGDSRWPLRDKLTAIGWQNDPGDWNVNIEVDCGGLVAELGGMYWTRRFGELLRAPASTNPVIASVMVRLAKVDPGQTVLDPFCGAGTLLVAASQMTAAGRVLGGDHDRRWVAATRDNLASRSEVAVLWRGDARAVPLPDGSVDRVVSNLPFGKRVGSHTGNKQLYPAVLAQVARLLPRGGRAVLLTEDKRLFVESVQRTRGIRVVKDITFTTGGAHPSAYVVTTRRGR